MKMIKGIITTTLAMTIGFAGLAQAANQIAGDYNGDGNQDAFNQAINPGETSSLTPLAGSSIASFHKSWTTTHPDISTIPDWSADKYGAYSANLNSNPGDELLLLGKRKIILIHGDIITPIVLKPEVDNAVVSWNASSVASAQEFIFDGNPDDFKVQFGDFNGDGYAEIVMQGKTTGSDTFILNSNGSVRQTLYNGYLGLDWSVAAHGFVISDLNGDGIADITLTPTDGSNAIIAYSSSNGSSSTIYLTEGAPPVTPDAIPDTLPDHDPSAGAIAGQFRVDESGQANYSIQIATVTGSGGVAPAIGLSYSSQGGNGILGVGWNISGQSAITRCRRTWEQDNINAAVDLTSADRFCLNGQRLMLITGSYGAANSTYKTEIDSQVEVKALGGTTGNPASFSVGAKDGSVSEYGNSGTSKQYSNAEGSESIVTTWAQSKFTDNADLVSPNSYTYTYTTDAQTKEFLISRIDYSGVSSNSIQFEYEPRPDVTLGWSATGSYFESGQRLIKVDSYAGTEVIRSYQLSYDNDTSSGGQSLLQTLKECVGNTCLAPTTFNWQKIQTGFRTTAATSTPNIIPGYVQGVKGQPIDINGDGLQDVAYNSEGIIMVGVSNGNSISYYNAKTMDTEYHGFWHQLDYNGDGKTDLMYIKRWGGLYNWTISLSDGEFFTTEFSIDILVDSGDEAERMRVMDINGDALPDLVYQKSAASALYVKYMQLNADGTRQFGSESTLVFENTPSDFSLPAGWIAKEITLKDTQVVDFNGDGLVDVFAETKFYENVWVECQYPECNPGEETSGFELQWRDTRWTVFVAKQSIEGDLNSIKYTPYYVMIDDVGIPTEAKHYRVQDVNSDGLADIAYRYTHSLNWVVLMNKGQGNFGGVNDSAPIYIGRIVYDDYFQFMDYTNDGNLDILFIGADDNGQQNNYLYVRPWYGYEYGFAPEALAIATGLESRDRDNALRLFMDINGDGVSDYLNLEVNNSNVFLSNDTLKKNNVITIIDNGLGSSTQIDYKPLTDLNVYARSVDANMMVAGNSSPVFDVISPMYVVSSATSTSPGVTGSSVGSFEDDATSTVRYRYKGARMQSGGRGFLGFEILATLDPQTGMETTTTYLQQYPYIGRPHMTVRRLVGTDAWPEEERGCNGDCPPDPCDYLGAACILSDWQDQIIPALDFNFNFDLAYGGDLAGDGIELSRSTNVWDLKSLAGGSQFPYLEQSIEVSWTPSYNLPSVASASYSGLTTKVSTVTTTNSYDNYANPTQITVVTKNGSGVVEQTKSTVNTYGTSDTYKRYGRLTNAVVTTTVGGETSSRESAFEYDSNNMLLSKEIIEPNSPNAATETLITDYQRDNFGNITRKTTCSSAVSVANCGTSTEQNLTDPNWINRWASTTYDAYGTYPVTTSKPLDTNSADKVVQTIVSRNKLGQVTQSQDIFGTVTVQEYDEFGFLKHSSTGTGFEQWSGRILSNGAYGTTVMQKTVTLGAPTKVQYSDALGRVVSTGVKGFDGVYIYKDTVSDTQGRTRFISNPYKQTRTANWSSAASDWTESIFDVLGRVIETRQADGFTNKMYHNGLTLLSEIGIGDQQINGSNGLTKSETKNALGQLTNIEDHIGGSIDYEYDLYGKLTRMHSNNVANSKTITTEIEYDDLGRKIKTIDPDMGIWTYQYNAIGELTRQEDALGQITQSFYDQLGRLVQRQDFKNTNTQVGDTHWNFNPDFGYLEDVENSYDNDYLELYEYDDFGRIKFKQTFVDTNSNGSKTLFKQQTWYDNAGRVSGTASNVNSATGLPLQGLPVVANEYNQNGYLEVLRNANDNTIFWQAIATDNFGNVTTSQSGDGRYLHSKSFNSQTGLVESHAVQGYGGSLLQQLSYQWDTLGNLRLRRDENTNIEETFGYDQLNRLEDATIDSEVKNYQYDDFGNITNKDNKAYLYQETGSAGPHAVTDVDGISYIYDANGNQTSGDGRELEYSTFGKPVNITKGNAELRFNYGPGRNRYKKLLLQSDDLKETKITAGGVEVIYKTVDGTETTEIRAYITDALLKFTYTDSSIIPTKKTQYLFKDHLGSTDTVVTPNGNSDDIVKMSFGSFGERRNVNWDGHLTLTEILDLDLSAITDKGYTGHEQLDDVGLIHMKGRVYDPKLGRFMSADPHIQAPTDTQSLNRYSYVLNNPLSATDPSGYFSLRKWVGTIVAVVGGAICGPTCSHLAYVAIGAASGAAGAAANGGNILKGALIGAFTGEVFYQIGQYAQSIGSPIETTAQSWQAGAKTYLSGSQYAGIAALHAAAGGVAAVLNGGKFGHGFVSAGFTKSLGHAISQVEGNVAQLVVTTAVAGTASKLVGGKFANGAASAAFVFAIGKPELAKDILDWVIGEDFGAAWRSLFTEKWVRGPTGGKLPESLAADLEAVGRAVPKDAFKNGMHAWHAGSNALLAKKFGLLGAPLIQLAGLFHESPLDWGSFSAEQNFQGTLNHFLDSVSDIGANLFGMGVGYILPVSGVDSAIEWGNHIPGPGDPDPAFGGGGPYTGSPTNAWGQSPK